MTARSWRGWSRRTPACRRRCAATRVSDVEGRIHQDEVTAAETARKTAAYASLWTAFALLFGAIIAVAASISARWEDDKEHGILPGTRISEVRF